MNHFTYKCDINKTEILSAIERHDCYDSWGDAEYGNSEKAVEYNVCIDNSTNQTEYLSAFYRIAKGKDGCWQHDDCQEWYSYEINFSDAKWQEKLKEAAIKAYNKLWNVS